MCRRRKREKRSKNQNQSYKSAPPKEKRSRYELVNKKLSFSELKEDKQANKNKGGANKKEAERESGPCDLGCSDSASPKLRVKKRAP